MNELIIGLAEKTVLGAGFLYLLYYLIQNMTTITANLTEFGWSMKQVSETMVKLELKFDMGMEQIKERINKIEERI